MGDEMVRVLVDPTKCAHAQSRRAALLSLLARDAQSDLALSLASAVELFDDIKAGTAFERAGSNLRLSGLSLEYFYETCSDDPAFVGFTDDESTLPQLHTRTRKNIAAF